MVAMLTYNVSVPDAVAARETSFLHFGENEVREKKRTLNRKLAIAFDTCYMMPFFLDVRGFVSILVSFTSQLFNYTIRIAINMICILININQNVININ